MENEVFLRNSDLIPQSIELLGNSLRLQFKSHVEKGFKIESIDKESVLALISHCRDPDLILQILDRLPS